MIFIKKTLSVIFFLISLLSFSQANSTLKFYQNDKLLPISKNNEISLKKQAFSLTYFYKKYKDEPQAYYALQICFLKNKKELENFKIGTLVSEIQNFKEGSAFKYEKDGKYDTMVIGTQVHNYLYYANEKTHSVELLQNLRNDFEGRWTVNDFIDEETKIDGKLSKLKEKVLYMVVFKDENLNEIIDQGELLTYTLKFF